MTNTMIKNSVETLIDIIKSEVKSKVINNKNNYFVEVAYYTRAICYVTVTFKGVVEKYLINNTNVYRLDNNVTAIFSNSKNTKFIYKDFIKNLKKLAI